MATLGIGLIGCGHIAQAVHLAVISRLAGARLVALAEPDARRREEAARRAPQAAADYHHLLAMPQVEAVVICTPTTLHAEVAIAALEQGKHVYLEKPLATGLDEAQRVLAAWRSAGTVGMIGFNYRFSPLNGAVRQYLVEKHVGELTCVRSVFSAAPHDLPAWKQARRSGGGVLLDLASHHVDLVRFFFEQEIGEVSAALRSQRGEDDSAVTQLRLAGRDTVTDVTLFQPSRSIYE